MKRLLERKKVGVGRDEQPRSNLGRGRIERLEDRGSTVVHAQQKGRRYGLLRICQSLDLPPRTDDAHLLSVRYNLIGGTSEKVSDCFRADGDITA